MQKHYTKNSKTGRVLQVNSIIVSSFLCVSLNCLLGFPGSSVVKNPPAMQETRVPFLSQEDIPEEEMTTHSSILAWKIPWAEEPGKL